MKKNRPNFRIIERPTNEIPPKYPEFKRLYIERLDMRKYEIKEALDLTQSEMNSFTKRVREETGLERYGKARGKEIILKPITMKKKEDIEKRFYQKDYESIYEDFKHDYLHTRLQRKEFMEKYDLKNSYQYLQLRELVEERTGWSRRNLYLLINKVTGERRRIKP